MRYGGREIPPDDCPPLRLLAAPMPDLHHSHDRRQLRKLETGVKLVFACTLTSHFYRESLRS
jgi:hypothetical protein